MKQSTSRKFDIFIFIFALGLRLAYDVFLSKNYLFYGNPGDDVAYYQRWATLLLRGDGPLLSTFYGLPLYPHVLSVFQALSLNNPVLIRFCHLILGSINCVLLFRLAKGFMPLAGALTAGVLMGLNFTLIHYDWLMTPVPVLVFLNLLLCLSLTKTTGATPARHWFAVGLLNGIAIAGDPKFLIFAFLILIWLIVKIENPLSHKVKKILGPFLIGLSLVSALLLIRNGLLFRDGFLISPQGGLSFYAGNGPGSSGVFRNPDDIRPDHFGQDEDQRLLAEKAAGRNLTPAEVSAFWFKQALTYIRQKPGNYLRLLAHKARLFLTDDENGHSLDLLLQRDWQQRLDINPFFIICPLAILGWGLLRKTGRGLFAVDAAILSQFLVTILFFHSTRHRAGILPFLLMYESVFILWFINQVKARRFLNVGGSLLLVVIFILLFPPKTVAKGEIDFLYESKAGVMYQNRKEFDRAEKAFVRAWQLNPNDTATIYNLGTNFLYQGRLDSAKQCFLAVLTHNSHHMDALYNLAYVYEQQGESRQAENLYLWIEQQEPNQPDVLCRLMNIYQARGEESRYNDFRAKLLKQHPGVSCPYKNLQGQSERPRP